MYRFYFKLKNEQNCIIGLKDVIAENAVKAYKVVKKQFNLKPELITRKDVLYKRS